MPAGLFLSFLAAVAPQSGGQEKLTRFEQLTAAQDYRAASAAVDEMILASSGDSRPDPLISGLYGRLLVNRAPPTIAIAFLALGDSDSVPLPQHLATVFALATTQESSGQRQLAAETYRRLQSLASSAADRRRAELGLARAQLADAPASSLATARSLAAVGNAAERWEAELLAAQASLLLGDRGGARLALDRAWGLSAEAPAASFAPLRTAIVKAALADREGRRDALFASFVTTMAGSNPIDPDLADLLPICGARQVQPEDWVTFGAFADSDYGQALTPLAASRAAAVAPFMDALDGAGLFERKDRSAVGTIFTVRCRTAISPQFNPPPRQADPRATWFASRGLYIPFGSAGNEWINRLSERIEQLSQARPDDPRLIALRLGLAASLAQRASSVGDVQAWQLPQLEQQSKAAMRRLGGTDIFLFELSDFVEKIGQEPSDFAAALAAIQARLLALAADAPLESVYEFTPAVFASSGMLPPAFRKSWIETLLRRFDDRRDDPRRQALQLRLVEIERDQDLKAAHATWRGAGLPADLCAAADVLPAIDQHHIDDEDFPRDALPFKVAGNTVAEFAVTASGRTSAPRILLAAPSSIFDPIFLQKLGGFEMRPAQTGGHPISCRGVVQRVRWKIPEGGENRMPIFADPDPSAS